MKIIILNGNHNEKNVELTGYLSALIEELKKRKKEVHTFNLLSMNVKPCTGCWACWVRTPGECTQKDDVAPVLEQMISSDLVIMASPLVQGFISAKLKACIDRMIPLYHPFIEIHEKECMHRRRYDSYPLTASLFQRTPDTDDEDVKINLAYMKRFAEHQRKKMAFMYFISKPAEEVADEISSL